MEEEQTSIQWIDFPTTGYAESFNGRMRDELLNETLFCGIDQARQVIATWAANDNTIRPHSALGYRTLAGFAAGLNVMGPSAPLWMGSADGPIAQPAPIGSDQCPDSGSNRMKNQGQASESQPQSLISDGAAVEARKTKFLCPVSAFLDASADSAPKNYC